MIAFILIALCVVVIGGMYIKVRDCVEKVDALNRRITKHGIPKNNTRKK